jgi:hypothetical protein
VNNRAGYDSPGDPTGPVDPGQTIPTLSYRRPERSPSQTRPGLQALAALALVVAMHFTGVSVLISAKLKLPWTSLPTTKIGLGLLVGSGVLFYFAFRRGRAR